MKAHFKLIENMNHISINSNFNNILHIEVKTTLFIYKSGNINYIDVPSFNIQTFVDSMSEAEIAIKEALTCYFVACESHGEGIEKELKMSSWIPLVENKLPIFDAGLEYEYKGKCGPNTEYFPQGINLEKFDYHFLIDLPKK